MANLTYADQAITTGAITRTLYGAWVGDVAFGGASVPTGQNMLKVGKLALRGTVHRGAAYGGQSRMRVVAGGDGWRKILEAKGYSHIAGVKMSDVLKDAAAEAGEQISIASDVVLGVHYARERAKAAHVLRLLTNGVWWIDDNGVTQVRERPTETIKSAFTVTNRNPDKAWFEIGTEFPEDWVPGRTFTSPVAPGTHTISSVTIRASGAAVRLEVQIIDTDRERMLAAFRAMVREETAHINYLGVWEYEVLSGTSTALELKSLHKSMPNLSKVPCIPGLMGEEVTPAPNSKCYVAFANADPTKPKCVGIEGDPLLVKLNTTSFVLNNGARPVARAADFAGPFPIAATGVDFLGV